MVFLFFFFFQAEDGIRDADVTGVQTCALPISILRSNSHTGAVKMLRQGRGDYLLDYRSQVQSALGSLEMEPLPWVPVVELPMRLLLSRHSGFAEQLKQDLDEAFDRLKARDAQMEVNL